jgi:hypothetical protein
LREIVKLNTLNSVLTNSKFDMKKANLNIDQDAQLNNYEVLGGIDGLCMALKAHKVKPDFKFFNTLLLVRNFIKNGIIKFIIKSILFKDLSK